MVQEIDELKGVLMPWLVVFAVLFTFLLAFTIKKEQIMGYTIFLPVPAIDSLSLSLFQKIQHDLLPRNIKILITNPLDALLVQINVSLFFSFLISFPILLYRMVLYLSPALHKNERKTIMILVFPAVLLFLFGCIFSYFFLIPSTIKLFSLYLVSLNAATYFEINKFISFVLGFTLVSAVAFVLPIFMKILSGFGITSRAFWRKNFKYVFIAIIVFSVVIAPDIVTMFILSLILIALYALGYFLS